MSFSDEQTTWDNTPTEWNATGVEPTTELKEKGFTAGYKPPADYFNHLFNKIYTSIKELQKKVATRAEIQIELDKKAASNHAHNYAGSDTAGGAATKAKQDGNGNVIADTYATQKNPVFTGKFAHGGSATGEYATTIGGVGNEVNSYCGAILGGSDSMVSQSRSVVLGGYGNKVTNYDSAVLAGTSNTASNEYSAVLCGRGNTAAGAYSAVMGYFSKALTHQVVIGHYNNTETATENATSGTSTGSAFVIGNGSSGSISNAFRVQGDGVVYAKGAYNATGADYAEYAEWADGNENVEDRRGYFVTYDEEKPKMIRKANAGDYILGVVSGNPCIIGNSDEDWLGRYIFDEFGSIVYETVAEELETLDAKTGETKKEAITVIKYKENPEYDSTREYQQRAERKEWAAVGWLGVLSVRDNGTCVAGGYCTVADGGTATRAERGANTYRVIERVTDNVVKIALK